MAVGLERAHPELVGQSEGLLIVGVGCCACQGVLMCVDLPVEPQSVGLVSPRLEGTGERQGTRGEVSRLVYAASQQIRLAQIGNPTRMARRYPPGGILRHRLLQQREGLGNAFRQGIGIP